MIQWVLRGTSRLTTLTDAWRQWRGGIQKQCCLNVALGLVPVKLKTT